MSHNIAFVFPGQGSQAVGMLGSLIADNKDIVDSACQEASAVLGYDMAQLIESDPEQKLNNTEYTQPALLTVGVIAWRIWQDDYAVQPKFLAGHSLGEYTALVCAKALSFTEGLKLVAKRGELMQQAVAPGVGAMAAILGLTLEQVNDICNSVGFASRAVPGSSIGLVQAANINAPGQIVIAGNLAAVEAAIEKTKNAGAKRAIMLPVSVPSHCELMRPAADQFVNYLAAVKWQKPQIPVIHNYDVTAHDDAASICTALQKQLYSPVRWVETVEYFVQQGIDEIIESAPGKVLTGLNKRIAPTLNLRSVSESLGAGLC